MGRVGERVNLHQVIGKFQAYYNKVGPAWGRLHVILDDGNDQDNFIRDELEECKKDGDLETQKLCELLLRMSRTQRRKISKYVK